MKNKGMLLLCAPLLMTLALTGCDASLESQNYVNKDIAKIAEKNAKTYDGYAQKATLKVHGKFTDQPIYTNGLNFGVYAKKDANGNIVFVNIVHDKVILQTNVKDIADLAISTRRTNGTILFMVSKDDQTIMFDSLGNEIKGVEPDAFQKLFIEFINGGVYLKDLSISNVSHFYKLGENGYERIGILPARDAFDGAPIIGQIPGEDEVYHGPLKLNLDALGKPGYCVYVDDGKVTTFKGEEVVANFTISENANVAAILGANIIYQDSYRVSDYDSDFDYYDAEGKKHVLKTYIIDALTGVEREMNFNFLIDEVFPLKNEEGFYKLGYFSATQIKDRILTHAREYIFDENLTYYSDVSGINMTGLIKTGNGYYDESSNTIYNKNMQAISYLSSFEEAKYYAGCDAFAIMSDNQWGLLDSNGKCIMPMEYDFMIGNQTSNNIAYTKDRDEITYNIKEDKVVLKHNYDQDKCYSMDGGEYHTLLTLVDNGTTFSFTELDGEIYKGDYKIDPNEPFNNLYISNSMDERSDVILVKKDGVNEVEKFVFYIDEQGIKLNTTNFTTK